MMIETMEAVEEDGVCVGGERLINTRHKDDQLMLSDTEVRPRKIIGGMMKGGRSMTRRLVLKRPKSCASQVREEEQ